MTNRMSERLINIHEFENKSTRNQSIFNSSGEGHVPTVDVPSFPDNPETYRRLGKRIAQECEGPESEKLIESLRQFGTFIHSVRSVKKLSITQIAYECSTRPDMLMYLESGLLDLEEIKPLLEGISSALGIPLNLIQKKLENA